MKTLFDSVDLGGVISKNRIVRSATFENAADANGIAGPELKNIYQNLAKGGVGVIITGMFGVDENSRISPNMIKTYADAFLPSFWEITSQVQSYGSKIVAQLSHCGLKATFLDNGGPALGPSSVQVVKETSVKAMDQKEIKSVIRNFAESAAKCRLAGFDAVQIHAAHGYLLSQFLSPYFNKRQDEYGGPLANRARLLTEIYDNIRSEVGNDYSVWIKINGQDLIDQGMSCDESIILCQNLSKKGLNVVEVSGGISVNAATAPVRPVKNTQDEGYFAALALRISQEVVIPVISVGGYRTPTLMEECLNKGQITAISLCRPLICEPDLVKRWQEGDLQPARCISCNKCFKPKEGFGCQAF